MNARLKELQRWLKETVVSPSNPKEICLSEFEFDEHEMCGSFCLTLDEIKLSERFDFAIEIDGKYGIYPPMFTSPLGVPASYAAIEINDETKMYIKKMIDDFFPEMRPFGIQKESKKLITSDTPMSSRVKESSHLKLIMKELKNEEFKLKFRVIE